MAALSAVTSGALAGAAGWSDGMSQRTVAGLHAVSKRYGTTVALDKFSFHLGRGEVVALLGPNGAGKTTAVRLLLGLTSPSEGSAHVLGRDPRDSETRTGIGVMLQIARVPEMLRVREHIESFRAYYPSPLPLREIVQAAGLEGLEERMFGTLSGGQKQRVLFALALCGNPSLVILDEPTVGMDIESRRNLWDRVRALAAAGKTVLLTTHYLEEADALASRVVVLNRGKLVCEGTPAEIRHRVAGRRIRCVTQLERGFLQSLPTVTEVREDREAVVITAEKAEEVVRAMLARDHTLSGLEIAAPALEDAFLALTSQAQG